MGSGGTPPAKITRSSNRIADDPEKGSSAFLHWVAYLIGEFARLVIKAFECLGAARGQERDQADRAIRTSQLNALLRFHTWPINVVVFHGSSGRPGFEVGFPLRCIQRLSRPHIATRRCGWRHNRYTRGAFIPVLSY